jgi:hypothetical protein
MSDRGATRTDSRRGAATSSHGPCGRLALAPLLPPSDVYDQLSLNPDVTNRYGVRGVRGTYSLQWHLNVHKS